MLPEQQRNPKKLKAESLVRGGSRTEGAARSVADTSITSAPCKSTHEAHAKAAGLGFLTFTKKVNKRTK